MDEQQRQQRGAPVVERAVVHGVPYEVEFRVRHHRPAEPREGRHGVRWVTATTECTVRPEAPGVEPQTATAECSERDRFRYTVGCQRAMDRAVEALHYRVGSHPDAMAGARSAFRAQVMPRLAQRHREYLRRTRPDELGRLRREHARLRETLALMERVARRGAVEVMAEVASVGAVAVIEDLTEVVTRMVARVPEARR